MTYDLIVVGCGPAGASAALAAAEHGLTVLVLERKQVVGSPVRCGEYIPAFMLKDVQGVDDSVVHSLEGFEVNFPSGDVMSISSPGLMIERDRFDRALAHGASEAGADIVTSARVTGVEGRKVTADVDGHTMSYQGRVIIGADGPRSIVSRVMGCECYRFAVGVQERLTLASDLNWARIYYDHRYRGGYAWLFPKGAEANVGLAMDQRHARDIYDLYLEFKQGLMDEGFITSEKTVFRTGGLVPIGGRRQKIHEGHLLLAGDAAGAPNPMTGAGVAPAVISGRLAGESAAMALAEEDMSLLHGYPEEFDLVFPQERTLAAKKEIDASWGSPLSDDLLGDYWRGFV